MQSWYPEKDTVWYVMSAYEQNYYTGTEEFRQAMRGQMNIRSSGKQGIA